MSSQTYPYSKSYSFKYGVLNNVDLIVEYTLTVNKSGDKYTVVYQKTNALQDEQDTTYSIVNLVMDPLLNNDLIFVKSLNGVPAFIGNPEALTANQDLTKTIILKDETQYDSVNNVFFKKYYEISKVHDIHTITEKTSVVENMAGTYVGTKAIYIFGINQTQVIAVQKHDKYRPENYLFVVKKNQAFTYKQAIDSDASMYIYYEGIASVVDPTIKNLSCMIQKQTMSYNEGDLEIKKVYTWNDGYKYSLRSYAVPKTRVVDGTTVTYYEYSLYKQLIDDGVEGADNDANEVLISTSENDPFLSLILVNNGNGVLNVDLNYSDFNRMILKTQVSTDLSNPDAPAVFKYFLIDITGQTTEMTQSQVDALNIKNGITSDGRQIIEYFTSETHSAIIVINLATVITTAIDSDGDEICDDIMNYVDLISNYDLDKVGRLGDYSGLIDKINTYTDTLKDHQVDLSLEQVTVLEGYANYMNQMSGVFGQLIASIETSSLIDASNLQLRIKLALKAIYEGLQKVQKFKIAITDSRIIGIPECIIEMSETLEKLLGDNGKLNEYEQMINYFLSEAGDFEVDDPIAIKFGLTQADKDAIAAAEALITKYTNDLINDAQSIKNHSSIVNLQATLTKFEDKKQKLIELNNKLLYTLGASGIKIKTFSSTTTTSFGTTSTSGSSSRQSNNRRGTR